ncbi:MAG TPA: hypothetical protein VFI03_03185 [Solirubrobacterales bacterium]|nr:hypothetical protein [Solirubrobacterales bacterium]
MSLKQHPASTSSRDQLPLVLAGAALVLSLAALVFSMAGFAESKGKGDQGLRPHGLLRLDAKGKIPLAALPNVPRAKSARKLGGATRSTLTSRCPVSNAIDLGTWCLESTTYRVPPQEAGKNDFFYATQKCVKEGGWLPSAAQLIGAARKVGLKSTIDDDPGTSGTTEFPNPSEGIKDEREMTSDLFTTDAGSRAAGSEGVTPGSKGVGNIREPDPVPMPADPAPETLNYITVYDNHGNGGFAGGVPVSRPENFRCAYAKGHQGKPRDTSSRS